MKNSFTIFAIAILNLALFSYPLLLQAEQKYQVPLNISQNEIVKLSQKYTQFLKATKPVSKDEILNEKQNSQKEAEISRLLEEIKTLELSIYEDSLQTPTLSETLPEKKETSDINKTHKFEILDTNKSIKPKKYEIFDTNKSSVKFKILDENKTFKPKETENLEANITTQEFSQTTNDTNKTTLLDKKNKTALFIGDSLMQGVAFTLTNALQKDGFKVINLGQVSTGLTNKKFFNWQNRLEQELKNSDVDIVFVMLGANDPWSIKDSSGKYKSYGTSSWDEIYRLRIAEILTTAKDKELIWIGIPCMRKSDLNSKVSHLNTLYKSVVKSSNQTYVSSTDILCGDGNYNKILTINGKRVSVRANDGIHLTMNGSRLITNEVMKNLSYNKN
ncbi:DUF459 domain-containing protein [Campylobacter corcagiensis]|uniref:DUF459 domain-containing protein n=1 Tax=Campylobacter corcagiensis TaxID=1448857 RepID=A0A7M1LIR6_9BACT|nr:DUF459 domain-containing protein [Campylobacter corcagiensis]QKF63953.1 putative periplasmic SGNH family hydrolase (SGNH_peri2 domain) [Campylobacter corcagiensis]QOQ87844.1 DUF459 domain-containing protein [Campylobacter corcagiensis]